MPQAKCKHENNPVDTHLITERVYTNGARLIAARQCCVCNQTLEESQPLPQQTQQTGEIVVFFDWDALSWEPISQRPAYEQRQLAKITASPAASAPGADPEDSADLEDSAS